MPSPQSIQARMNTAHIVQTIAVYAIPLLLAITLHEASHGYVAWYLGDDTARSLGRVTLNPLKHIDPFGTVIIPLVLFASGSGFLFGYAKPVPVHMRHMRHPRRDMALVALAGPASNLLQAIVWAALGYCAARWGLQASDFFARVCTAGVLSNLVMFAFNLFPVPPLDGGRVLAGLLPPRWAYVFSRIEPYGFFIVMGLVMTQVIGTYWMRPVMHGALVAIQWLLTPLRPLV